MGTRARPSPRPEGSGAHRVVDRLRPAGVAVVLILAVAPYVGMLWEKLTPAPTYINLSGEVYLDNQDTSAFIAADGWFLILGLLVGVASAALAYWRWRGDLVVIVAMAATSVLGSVIAQHVGQAFGPAPIQQTALTLADGHTIHGSIKLAAHGVLFAWAVGILLTYLSLIAGLERSSADDADEADEVDAVDEEPGLGWAEQSWTGPVEKPVPVNGASVGAAGLAGDVGAGQRGQVGEHEPLPAEKGELGP